jgi:hypothetical protein
LRSVPTNAACVIVFQSYRIRLPKSAEGALGNDSAGVRPVDVADRIRYRTTTPKFPPPPPVCAHQRSLYWLSRVATTARARPWASTTTTSTPYRWSTTEPYLRDSGPYPPPLK